MSWRNEADGGGIPRGARKPGQTYGAKEAAKVEDYERLPGHDNSLERREAFRRFKADQADGRLHPETRKKNFDGRFGNPIYSPLAYKRLPWYRKLIFGREANFYRFAAFAVFGAMFIAPAAYNYFEDRRLKARAEQLLTDEERALIARLDAEAQIKAFPLNHPIRYFIYRETPSAD